MGGKAECVTRQVISLNRCRNIAPSRLFKRYNGNSKTVLNFRDGRLNQITRGGGTIHNYKRNEFCDHDLSTMFTTHLPLNS